MIQKTETPRATPAPQAPRQARRSGALSRALLLATGAAALTACGGIGDIFDVEAGRPEQRIEGQRKSILTAEDGLSADPALATVPVNLPTAYVNFAWPQPGGSPTNVLLHLQADSELERLWEVDAGKGSNKESRLVAPPIVAEERIYVLDAASTLRAFDAATGAEIWDVELVPEDEDERDGFGGGIAYESGRIFLSDGFGALTAFDAATGERVWQQTIPVPFRAAPTAFDGRVYVTASDNNLYAFATEDGVLEWSYPALVETSGILSAPSPAVNQQVVLAPFSSGELIAFRPQNGTPQWSDTLTRAGTRTPLNTISGIAARPLLYRGQAIGVSHAGRMAAIDVRTGERIWQQNLASVETPWVAGDFLFAVSLEGEVVAVSLRDGRVKWITQLPAFEDPDDRDGPIRWSGPVLINERLLLVSSEGEAVFLSPYDGERLGGFELPDPVYITPVVANERVYFLTDDARLIAYQ